MSERHAALLRQLIATHDGDPWYGTSRTRLLDHVDHKHAAEEPIPGAHSIWGLVLHMTAWTNEVRRRLGGRPPADPLEGDWPPVIDCSAGAWAAALAALTDAHRQLLDELSALSDEGWHAKIGETRDSALGTGVDVEGMIVGLAQHDAYHVGQIATLMRAARLI